MKSSTLDNASRHKELEKLLIRQGELAEQLLNLSQAFSRDGGEAQIDRVEEFLRLRASNIKALAKLDLSRRTMAEEAPESFEVDERYISQLNDIRSAMNAIISLDTQLTRHLHQAELRAINNMAFASNYINFGNISDAANLGAKRIVDLKR
ncbi:hypothetical protein ACFL6E_02575 [Candidatus Neomarinimicrobiota bacterium]